MAKKKPKKSSRMFVLDASVTLSWFFEDETYEYAEQVQEALAHDTAVAPTLWSLEVANVLIFSERRKRTTEAKVTAFVNLLKTLSISVDELTAKRAWSDTLSLARVHKLSAYDATYLELALRRGIPLATLDRQLREAAKTAGVDMYKP